MLTRGTLHAQKLLAARGYEAIVFHAVGTGGRAMELMMRQGIIGAVFDYAMGEISDELFHGLRAGGAERLTVAGALGLPQVLVPGGAEHLGILVSTPHVLPRPLEDAQARVAQRSRARPAAERARAAPGGARGGQAPPDHARQRGADAPAARHGHATRCPAGRSTTRTATRSSSPS